MLRLSSVMLAMVALVVVPASTPAATPVASPSGLLSAAAGDSPWWPPKGIDTGAAPTDWGEGKNIAWVADVPGRGHASPCVVGEQIFISTALDDAEEIRLIAYNRDTGDEEWNLLLHEGGFLHTHSKNTHASGTPACDGQRVFVAHLLTADEGDGVYLSAVSTSGELLWQKSAGPFITQHGYGSSPVLYGDTVIVLGDSSHEDAFLAAFDRASGDEVWRTPRGLGRTYGCPTIVHTAGRDQLVVPGGEYTVSYDPKTGKELWRVFGPSSSAGNTVVADDAMVYSSGGWPEKNLLAIRADGAGDVTDTHIAWRHSRTVCYVPTMLLKDGRLFTVTDDGIALCYDTDSGDLVWRRRLGGNYSASPVLVGDNIYIPDEDGNLRIFAAADKYTPIAEVDLKDGGFATPVVLQGKIYLRTLHRLYCIAE